MKKKRWIVIVAILAVIIALGTCGNSTEAKETQAPKEAETTPEPIIEQPSEANYMLDLSTTGTLDTEGLTLEFGELISVVHGYDGVVVVKAKISPSYNNEATINQNYHSVCDLIKNYGFDACSELQYWAVADMTSGNESKVISFTVDADTIAQIKDGSIVAKELGDYVSDLYILPSLLK